MDHSITPPEVPKNVYGLVFELSELIAKKHLGPTFVRLALHDALTGN